MVALAAATGTGVAVYDERSPVPARPYLNFPVEAVPVAAEAVPAEVDGVPFAGVGAASTARVGDAGFAPPVTTTSLLIGSKSAMAPTRAGRAVGRGPNQSNQSLES